MANTSLLFACTYPHKTPNFLALKQSLLSRLLCVHLASTESSLVQTVFTAPVQHWLEEFPPYMVRYPIEIASAMLNTLSEVYSSVRAFLRPTPAKPHYLFNFKDVARVVQGLLLVASKTKVTREQRQRADTDMEEDQASQQTCFLLRLFCHEVMRVFGDRMADSGEDSAWLKTTLANLVVRNFCAPKNASGMHRTSTQDSLHFTTSIPLSSQTFMTEQEDSQLSMGLENGHAPANSINNVTQTEEESSQQQQQQQQVKTKKGVTFVSGLFLNERSLNAYEGALVGYEQVLDFLGEEALSSLVFSRFIVKAGGPGKVGSGEKTRSKGGRESKSYTENSMNELMMAATESLGVYEYVKSLRINFVFHDQAIRHLARLTRVFVSFF